MGIPLRMRTSHKQLELSLQGYPNQKHQSSLVLNQEETKRQKMWPTLCSPMEVDAYGIFIAKVQTKTENDWSNGTQTRL